jgi:hypothetical protein
MKALIINSEIILRFQEVPRFLKQYRNVQRPDLLSEQELAERNIKIVGVDEPEFDYEVEELQNERYDPDLNKVIYDVVDLPIDLETERAKKHAEFENILYSEMTPALMFAVIEKLALGDPMPPELITTLTALRAREVQVTAEINTITDPKELKKYKFNPVEIEEGKEALKSTRKL